MHGSPFDQSPLQYLRSRLGNCETPDEVCSVGLREILATLRFQAGAIFLNDKNGVLSRRTIAGTDASGGAIDGSTFLVGERYDEGQGLPGEVILPTIFSGFGRAMFLSQPDGESLTPSNFAAYRTCLGNVHNIACMPLNGSRQSFGSLMLLNMRDEYGDPETGAVEPKRWERMTMAADFISAAISLARARSDLAILAKITWTMALADHTNPNIDQKHYDDVLQLIVGPSTVFKAAVLRIADATGNLTLKAKAGNMNWTKFLGLPVRKDSPSLAGLVFREGRAKVVADARLQPLLFHSLDFVLENGVRSVAAFPLISGDSILGTLTVFTGYVHHFPYRALESLKLITSSIMARAARSEARAQSLRYAQLADQMSERLEFEDEIADSNHAMLDMERLLKKALLQHPPDCVRSLVNTCHARVLDQLRLSTARVSYTSRLVPIDVHGVIESAIRYQEVATLGQPITFQTALGSTKIRLIEDNYLQVILYNLLNNGVGAVTKAIETGAVQQGVIRVGAMEVERGGKWFLEITVTDNGIGISASDLPHVQAAEKGFSSNGAGRGKGLYRVKRIAELYGGYYKIDSTPGSGTQVAMAFDLRMLPIFDNLSKEASDG
jgi:signal transduction histidine kinase